MIREEHTISRVIYRLDRGEVRQAILQYAATHAVCAPTKATEIEICEDGTAIEICEDGTAIITTEYTIMEPPNNDGH